MEGGYRCTLAPLHGPLHTRCVAFQGAKHLSQNLTWGWLHCTTAMDVVMQQLTPRRQQRVLPYTYKCVCLVSRA
jgi:hypothetical protein